MPVKIQTGCQPQQGRHQSQWLPEIATTALPSCIDSPLPWSLCDNLVQVVIPSGARNLALSILKAVRDSSSPAAPRNDTQTRLSHTLSGRGRPATALSPAVAGRARGFFPAARRTSSAVSLRPAKAPERGTLPLGACVISLRMLSFRSRSRGRGPNAGLRWSDPNRT